MSRDPVNVIGHPRCGVIRWSSSTIIYLSGFNKRNSSTPHLTAKRELVYFFKSIGMKLLTAWLRSIQENLIALFRVSEFSFQINFQSKYGDLEKNIRITNWIELLNLAVKWSCVVANTIIENYFVKISIYCKEIFNKLRHYVTFKLKLWRPQSVTLSTIIIRHGAGKVNAWT